MPYALVTGVQACALPIYSPANTLLAVEITTLPGAGTLTDNGVAVTAGEFVPAKIRPTPPSTSTPPPPPHPPPPFAPPPPPPRPPATPTTPPPPPPLPPPPPHTPP